jgi:hypothetical protein
MSQQEEFTNQERASLIELHIAEYQALTTRCSYWITLQYAALTVILIFLSVAAALWSSPIDRRLFFWGSALFLQTIGFFWMQTQGEQYTAILYVEHVLRPTVNVLTKSPHSWCYEPFLASIRKPRRLDPVVSPEFWELPIAILATVMILAILARGMFYNGNNLLSGIGGWMGFILNMLFLVFQWMKTVEVRKIRIAFSEIALASGCRIDNGAFPWR